MSPVLAGFLQSWLDWAESGASDLPYSGRTGLCSNIYVYLDRCVPFGRWCEDEELAGLFKASGLNEEFPFGEGRYDDDRAAATQHKNPARLAWVREKLKEHRGEPA